METGVLCGFDGIFKDIYTKSDVLFTYIVEKYCLLDYCFYRCVVLV